MMGLMVGPDAAGARSAPADSRGFDTALTFISDQILAGHYVSGSRLPAERALAAELGVSRGAVREAIKVLQAQGIVTAAVGAGHGTRISTTQGNAFGRMLRLHLALQSTSFADLTETRVVLERAAAAAVAVADAEESLVELRRLSARMRAERERPAFNDLDTAFHVGIAGLARNGLIRDLTIAIREAVAGRILEAADWAEGWETERQRLVDEHDAILEALARRDPAAAADLCEAHIRRAHGAMVGRDEAQVR